MKLSELDFTVEHRAGKKFPHVDALSRHVGTVLNDKNLRREVVRDEQAKDKFCQNLNTGSLLTFVDHFSRYARAFPIPDQSAEVCARVYTREIVARHGTGSIFVTDQGSTVMSSFLARPARCWGSKGSTPPVILKVMG